MTPLVRACTAEAADYFGVIGPRVDVSGRVFASGGAHPDPTLTATILLFGAMLAAHLAGRNFMELEEDLIRRGFSEDQVEDFFAHFSPFSLHVRDHVVLQRAASIAQPPKRRNR